ncbi:MAG: trypsin-like peptidase domain-containing protein [Chloroflexi bacterium]|nr:trypsin-like peptidase domain-containing protein [Chloroflexota bacterium]MCC6891330.1 trypsin-like peptidase domain-containing protein [Anaerolineae bacterium]
MLLLIAPTQLFAQSSTIDIDRLQRATVYIMQTENVGTNLLVTCVSSGTLLSRDGLILTNAHSTVPSQTCRGETLIVAMTTDVSEAPVPQYRAEIAQADIGIDLALLRITQELDGRLVDPTSLSLPFVELADSQTVKLDETVTVLGYPSIGNEPISSVRGIVTGFVFEPRNNDLGPAWLKSNAEIPGIMSGGGVYNQQSQLIAIPTTAPISASSGGTANCVAIQDTNLDRIVNASDYCVPTGVFINALRPSNFARPLLRAASLGLTVATSTPSAAAISATGTPTFKRLFFAAAVNPAGMPSSVISSLPAGSNSLYLFFDYENMTPETVYELRVTTDGIPNSTFSLSPVRWSGGAKGMWYIGNGGQPWPNGIYEFTLFADGVASPSQKLVIGVAPSTEPVFSDITFGLLDSRGQPQGNGFVLPAGNIASARFIYRNLENGLNWTVIWYLDGTEIRRATDAWNAGSSGSSVNTSIEVAEGLLPGSYRLELYIEDRLRATSDFTIAGAQEGALPQIFTQLRFTTANSDADALTSNAVSNFPGGVNTLYALFDWSQISPTTLWTLRWFVDGVAFYDQTVPWNNVQTGSNFLVRLSAAGGLPDGTYSVELRVNNVLLQKAQAQVGIGQLPIDRFARASGVQLRGRILSADTREGIAGVTVIVISEQFSVSDFTWNQDQIYDLAITDSNGTFEISRPLAYTTDTLTVAYSAIVSAQGYLPLTADGIEVTAETPNPLNLTIYLNKD